MPTKAQAALTTTVGLVLAVAVPVLIVGGLYYWSIARFVSDWTARFPAYDGFAAVPAADLSSGPAEELDEPVADSRLAKIRFADGSWVAVAERNRQAGGFAFDQAVLFDSAGALRKTSHHFGGWGSFSEELRRYSLPARSLDDFYRNADGLGLVMLRTPRPGGSAPPDRGTDAAPAGAGTGH